MYAPTNLEVYYDQFKAYMSEERLMQHFDDRIFVTETKSNAGSIFTRLTVPAAGVYWQASKLYPMYDVEPAGDSTAAASIVSRKFKYVARCVGCGEELTLGTIGLTTSTVDWKYGHGQTVGVCKSCMATNNFHRCSAIGCLAAKTLDDPDGIRHWCAKHAQNHGYKMCMFTGDLYHESQMIHDGDWWYSKRYEDYIVNHCPHCGRPMTADSSRYRYHDEFYCSIDCANKEGIYACGRCGDLHESNELRKDECNGQTLCEGCWEYNYHLISAREPRKDYDETTRGVKPTFGFEVELYRWPTESHRDWLPNSWGIHEDTTTGSGYEVLTPVVHLDQFESHIKCVMDYLIEHSQVTRKEGTHMHVGNFVNHDHAFRFWQLAVESERLWAEWFISESRQINQYCKDTNEESVTIKSTGFTTSSRYVKTNAQSYAEHGTVEIRAHQGTLDFRKMQMWARLFSQLWYHARDHKPMPRTDNMLNFFTDVEMPNDIAAYWKGRAADLREEVTPLDQMTATNFFRPTVYIYGDSLRRAMRPDSTWQQVYDIGMTAFRNLTTDDRALWNMLFDAMACDEENITFSTILYMSLNPEPEETPANLETNTIIVTR